MATSTSLESAKERFASQFNNGEPAWEIAELFPPQGCWTGEDYLVLTDRTNHLVELSEGNVEVLPMPTEEHQLVVLYLYRMLSAFIESQNLGIALTAPMRLLLWEGKFREPDLLFNRTQSFHRRRNAFWEGADLVMEVVSPDDPDRDYVAKRAEYAKAGIPEYWIVDLQVKRIMVLTLVDQEYRVHGEFGDGTEATSSLLPGFAISVGEVFAAAER